MLNSLDMKWEDIGNEWRINLVKSTNKRENPSLCLFGNLPKDKTYSLYIEYTINRIKPYKAENLTYERLRREISGNIVVPSYQTMNIFVSLDGRASD